MSGLAKKLLKEALLRKNSASQIKHLEDFVKFVCQELDAPAVPITLQFKHTGLVTTAAYGDKKINVYAKDRALVDIMRSIAHEYVHLKQDVDGRLEDSNHASNNAAGSDIENEANFKAGEIIRKWGEEHPEIYP